MPSGSGGTGHVTISPRAIQVRDLKSSSPGGQLAINGTFIRTGRSAGDLAAKVDADLDLETSTSRTAARVDAHVDVSRSRGLFAGTVDAKATGVALAGRPLAFDADAKIRAAAGQLSANVDVSAGKAGRARVVLDVAAPKDLTERARGRSSAAARSTRQSFTLDGIDLAAGREGRGAEADGRHDRRRHHAVSDAKSAARSRCAASQLEQTKDLGNINADIEVAQTAANELMTTISARLDADRAGGHREGHHEERRPRSFTAEARFGTPRPSDSSTRLHGRSSERTRSAAAASGPSASRSSRARSSGSASSARCAASSPPAAEVDAGMKAARISVNVYQLRGGLFAKPIDISVAGVVDDASSRVDIKFNADNGSRSPSVKAKIPLTFEQLRADPEAAKTAPLTATARIPHVPAVTLMNVLGTSQISGGTLDGTVEIGGTVARPTVDAKLVAREVTVPPEAEKEDADDRAAHDRRDLGRRGRQGRDRRRCDRRRQLARPRRGQTSSTSIRLTGSIEAKQLDIAPLVAFLPGPAGGLGGRLDANFTLRGADPRTAEIAGKLHITNGRIPIAPAVGTLFKGDVKIDVANHARRPEPHRQARPRRRQARRERAARRRDAEVRQAPADGQQGAADRHDRADPHRRRQRRPRARRRSMDARTFASSR